MLKVETVKNFFKGGTDALLLASYVLKHISNITTFVELGAGEGFSSQILAKEHPNARGLLVDCNISALEKVKNHTQLQLFCHDITHRKALRAKCKEEGFLPTQCVIANPPYYTAHSGRLAQQESYTLALHAQSDTLEIFCKAAYDILSHHGYFFMIYAPQALPEALVTLKKCGFGVRSLLPVHTRAHKSAQWILLLARKDAQDDLKIEKALCLYDHEKEKSLSNEALLFCPYL